MNPSFRRTRLSITAALLLGAVVCSVANAPAAEPVPGGSAAAPAPDVALGTGFYVVHPDDAAGRVQVMLGDQKYFVEPKPFLEVTGVASATIEHQKPAPTAPGAAPASQAPIGIRLTMTKEGAATLASATAQATGFRLAVVVDGEVVAMPVIREPVTSGMMVIAGSFSDERAKAIAAALSPKQATR